MVFFTPAFYEHALVVKPETGVGGLDPTGISFLFTISPTHFYFSNSDLA